MKAKS